MRAFSAPAMVKRRMSLFVSEETFHQKLTVAGPVTVVCMELEPLLPIAPLRAASTPSWLMLVWPTHGGAPFVVQVRVVASRAAGNGTSAVMARSALELVKLVAALLTT